MRKLPFIAFAVFATSRICSAGWRIPDPGLPKRFVIGIDTAAEVNTDDYRLVAKAGFNLVVPQRPGEEYNSALLKACEATGLKCVVWDPRISTPGLGEWSIRNEGMRSYKASPALAGYRSRNILPVTPAGAIEMWYAVTSIGNADQERFRYLEACHPAEFSDDDQFRRYLRQYLTRGLGYALYSEDDPYSAEAVAALRKVAEGCSRGNNQLWRRCRLPDASPAMIRWQAYSSAAGGAKGIIYCIVRPIAGSRADSLLDAAGAPTPACEAARAVNRRLAAIGPVLVKVRPSALYTVGSIFGQDRQPPNDSPIAEIESSAQDDGFLVGLLDGGRYAFVVRKPEGDDAAEVTIQCAAGKHAAVVETGKPAESLSLLPGEGQLLEIR